MSDQDHPQDHSNLTSHNSIADHTDDRDQSSVQRAEPARSSQPHTSRLILLIAFLSILLIGAKAASTISTDQISQWLQGTQQKVGNTINLDQRVVKEESLVIDVVKRTSPSVVSIAASQRLNDFFGNNSTNQVQGIGTGFIISENGLILTNKHVVSESDTKYTVITNDNKRYDVTNIYRDPANDLAIIKVNGDKLKPLEMGDSSKLEVGQFVIAIGNALGEFQNTVTTGVVSGLGRGITAQSQLGSFQESLEDLIQTDAAINPGNSGGPLLNSAGQVIGMNTAVSAQAQNIGFAIPINSAKAIVDQFNRTGRIQGPPYLGVGYRAISQRAAILNDVPQGMYINAVANGSPAAGTGLEVGDIITKIDDKEMKDGADLAETIRSKKIGDTVKLEYWRDGVTKSTEAKLIEAPAE
jgi:serine protease Do